MSNHNYNQVLNRWLRNIKDVYRLHQAKPEAIPDEDLNYQRLTALNVQEQVIHFARTSIIQRAWKYRQEPHLHGSVYGLKDGNINPVFIMKANTSIDPFYE